MADEYNDDAFRVMRGAIDAEHENTRALRACREEVQRLREEAQNLRARNALLAVVQPADTLIRERDAAREEASRLRQQLADIEADAKEYRKCITDEIAACNVMGTGHHSGSWLRLQEALSLADAACAARRERKE